jgi:hypothetical protein
MWTGHGDWCRWLAGASRAVRGWQSNGGCLCAYQVCGVAGLRDPVSWTRRPVLLSTIFSVTAAADAAFSNRTSAPVSKQILWGMRRLDVSCHDIVAFLRCILIGSSVSEGLRLADASAVDPSLELALVNLLPGVDVRMMQSLRCKNLLQGQWLKCNNSIPPSLASVKRDRAKSKRVQYYTAFTTEGTV